MNRCAIAITTIFLTFSGLGDAGELESLVRDGDYSAAAELAGKVDPATASAEDLLWKAITLRVTGKSEEAVELFHSVADDASGEITSRITAMANLLRDSRTDLLPANSAELAITYIEENESSPLLSSAFELLQQRNTLQRAIIQRQLEKWSVARSDSMNSEELPGDLKGISLINGKRPPVSTERRALADYYLGLAALANAEPEAALFAFEQFVEFHPEHQLISAATMRMAELRILLGRIDAAQEILSAVRSQNSRPAIIDQADYLEARLLFALGDYQGASAAFSDRSRRDTALSAPFNAAIAAIYADNPEAADGYLKKLADAPPLLSEESQKLVVELVLEKGLSQVAKGDPGSFELLEKFVRDHPDHSRVADAILALAELYLNQVPSQAINAREQLDAARELELSLVQREVLDYTAVWVESAAGEDDIAIESAIRFLDHWPHSPRRPSILMMLGEGYYRAGDFAKSTIFFESLAREAEESSLAEPALFFAAKAAARMLTSEGQERALALWDDVVLLGGPLAAHARHSQGLLALEQDRIDDAIAAFDGVFELFPSRELRIAVLCDKGQAAYAKALGEENPEQTLQAAISSFRVVENDGTASRAWRFQAATRRGKCYEALGENEEALQAYYSVIESVIEIPITPQLTVNPLVRGSSSSLLEEADWLHRAGFAAVQILQSQDSWTDALKIADFLATAGGARAIEAERYADQLRLKRFIWDTDEEE